MILFFLTSGLFLGWSLGANDASHIFGSAVGSKMVTFRKAAIIASVFFILDYSLTSTYICAIDNRFGAKRLKDETSGIVFDDGGFCVLLGMPIARTIGNTKY